MLRLEFPSGNFARDCDNAVRSGEAFEIVVHAGSGKINSVLRSIAEMRGESGQIYQFSSLLWDKPRTMALWVGLARAMALDWKLESALEGDLTVRVDPPPTSE
jgi:ABC-type dipeptide/oligopeptide/nickel transport system ATPase subunit